MAIGVFIGVMSIYASFTSDLPDIGEIENFSLDQASTVVSADGKELATFAVEDRRVIPFEQIPSVMIDAQVAAEDQTFWENPCVDFKAIVRAFLQNFQAGETVSGASTICQQLVGMRLLDPLVQADPDRRVELKVKEAILALRLGDRYPGTEGKQHIIEMYLNQVYYGNKAYGVWAAANAYFGKDITSDAPENQLTVSEAAMLASLVRAPSRLDPTTEAVEEDAGDEVRYVVPETAQAINTRNIVLKQMLESDFITQAEYDEALAEQIELAPPRDTADLAPHFVQAVRREANELLEGEELLDTGGLHIITTLDYDGYQTTAEKWAQVGYDMDRLSDEELTAKYGEAALGWIKQLQGRNINNDAIVTVNYRTGAVLAYVGSANFDGEATPAHQPKFDVIGQAFRQPGSAFKPITYSSAFKARDATVSTMLVDAITEFGVQGAASYRPTNADIKEHGPVLAMDALRYSMNIPSVQMQFLVGAQTTAEFAESLGIASADYIMSLDPGISLALGSVPVNLTNMTQAYTTFAQQGALHPATTIIEIRNREGRVIYQRDENGPPTSEPMTKAEAYLTHYILEANTDPDRNVLWGSRAELLTPDGQRRPAGFKTGTTDEFRDVSGFGYVPGSLVTGVWMGNNNQEQMSNQFAGGLFSADGPLYLWHDFMNLALNSPWDWNNQTPVGQTDFPQPNGIVRADVCRWSGMAATGSCSRVLADVPFLEGTVPPADNVHGNGCLNLEQYVEQAVPDRPQQ